MNSHSVRREAGKASTGCIVAAAVGGLVVVVGGIALAVLLGAGVYIWNTTPGGPTATGSPAGGGAPAAGSSGSFEKPAPTASQLAAVEGGQTVTWSGQGLSFSLPPKWTKQMEEKTSYSWSAPGYGAHLIVSIAPMSSDFPTATSLEAYFDQATQRLKNGEVRQVKRMELDGVQGIQFYEDTPADKDDSQRLQWIGYRDYLGQTQMINIILATKGTDAAKFEDTLYGILFSTKIPH
jgi:hypothetical protein